MTDFEGSSCNLHEWHSNKPGKYCTTCYDNQEFIIKHADVFTERGSLRTEVARLREALENIRHNSEYDMNKAYTNYDRGRFEIIWKCASQALKEIE